MGLAHSSFKSPPETPSSIDALTDAEVYTLIRERSKDNAIHAPNEYSLISDSVWRISQDAVAKVTFSPTEAFTMTYVSLNTSIPVPKVRRVLPAQPSDPDSSAKWIIMDYIDGDTLESIWPRMSWWKRLYAIWSMRRCMRELHKVPLHNRSAPGPFDGSGQSYACRGYYFTEDGAGPFRSILDMATWFNRRRFDVLAAMHSATGVVPRIPKFDDSHPIVLCHMDLHMRNIILDANGRIWIIDWANAGAFPPWLEYAHMTLWADAARKEARPPKFWTFFARYMVGDYQRYKTDYLDKLRWAWDRPLYDFFPVNYFSDLGLTID